MDGAGGCESGSQSGGFIRSSISFGVYFLVLPAMVFGSGVSGGSDPCCTGNAHAGSRAAGDGNAVDCTEGCCACSTATVARPMNPTTNDPSRVITRSLRKIGAPAPCGSVRYP